MLLDEALAGVAGGDVDDFLVVEEVFCQLFSACEHAHDVTRADQWIRVGEEVAQRRNLPVVTAFCRTHYGGVLTAAGRWPEADATLTEAVRLWSLGRRSGLREARSPAWPIFGSGKDASRRPSSFSTASTSTPTPMPRARWRDPSRSRRDGACPDVLERALEQTRADEHRGCTAADPPRRRPPGVGLARRRGPTADGPAHTCAQAHRSDYLGAVSALAQGRVCLATGSGNPYACLHEAVAGFARAPGTDGARPMPVRPRDALAADRPEVALTEARAAFDAFEQLQAARDADAAGALLRSLGAKPASTRPGGAL